MKPTKIRNKTMYLADIFTKSKQIGAALSKDLQKRHRRRSARITVGDGVSIVRGEYSGVDGRVSRVSIENGTVALEGLKKEKTKGDKYDVYVHASNIVITSLNTDDWWRTARLDGKDPKDKDLYESRSEAGEADEAEVQDEDEIQDEDAGQDVDAAKRARAEERKAVADEKRQAEKERAERRKQKDKKRQEPAEEEEYDDDEEED